MMRPPFSPAPGPRSTMWSADSHDVGIVLHDHDRVAEVAQFLENPDEAPGVAAVQADRGLIEHVAGAHEARAQAGGQLDALRLAA